MGVYGTWLVVLKALDRNYCLSTLETIGSKKIIPTGNSSQRLWIYSLEVNSIEYSYYE